MPAGRFRSRTLRRVHVRTPSGRTTIHYRQRKPSKAHCGNCRRPLAGVPRERPKAMQNLPKSSKRPERPYGGVLCSACMRSLFKQRARGSA
ncbi:50S ribosomal protein L34e [Candidatus Woesearchaeota archaeon]|nr:50S ribosomal protein L34e [Candidatus Woesearchaeota archaeon]